MVNVWILLTRLSVTVILDSRDSSAKTVSVPISSHLNVHMPIVYLPKARYDGCHCVHLLQF